MSLWEEKCPAMIRYKKLKNEVIRKARNPLTTWHRTCLTTKKEIVTRGLVPESLNDQVHFSVAHVIEIAMGVAGWKEPIPMVAQISDSVKESLRSHGIYSL